MATKLIKINELKENHEREYQQAYERWSQSQWEWGFDLDFHKESLKEKFKWLDLEEIQYSISYSQGDFASFTGYVDLLKFLDEKDTRSEYFVLREAIRLGSCYNRLHIGESYRRSGNVIFNTIEWQDWHEGDVPDDQTLEAHTSPLCGMPYSEYYSICQELIGDLETWIEEVCTQEFNALYYSMREDIEYQTSEESFIQWAESMDEEFEVEVEDENIGNDGTCEGARLAA